MYYDNYPSTINDAMSHSYSNNHRIYILILNIAWQASDRGGACIDGFGCSSNMSNHANHANTGYVS